MNLVRRIWKDNILIGTDTVPVADPSPRDATKAEVIEALPNGVVAAVLASQDTSVIKVHEKFRVSDIISPAEWDQLGNFLEGKSLMTAPQNTAFKAAKPLG